MVQPPRAIAETSPNLHPNLFFNPLRGPFRARTRWVNLFRIPMNCLSRRNIFDFSSKGPEVRFEIFVRKWSIKTYQ